MPRYSMTVTVRLDADDEDDAYERANEAVALGCDKNESVVDFTIDDAEDEDAMQRDGEG